MNLKQRLLLALEEDGAFNDITTRRIPRCARLWRKAEVMAKESGVFCGQDVMKTVFSLLSKKSRVQLHIKDGDFIRRGQKAVTITAPAHALLGGERVMLNLICHLSGVATTTRRYVQAVKGTGAIILDTRKTTPLWRDLERLAVRSGGGVNHRLNLSDAVLVKDNHQALLASQAMSLHDVYEKTSLISLTKLKAAFIEIEAATLSDVWQALKCRPDIILLDNMPESLVKKALVLIRAARGALKTTTPLVEVSGGIDLRRARRYATLGVDRISVGALTHSPKALDFSLEVA